MDIDTAPTQLPTVWRVGDVARFWQRDPRTVWRWVDAGRHPAPRRDPGGQPYWLPQDVVAFAGAVPDGSLDEPGPPQGGFRVPGVRHAISVGRTTSRR